MTILNKSDLSWSVHPLLQNSLTRSVSVICIIVFVSIVASYSFSHIGYGIISICCLFFSMVRYFLPSHYTVDEKGLHCELLWHETFREWSYFGRGEIRGHGIFLSPFVSPNRLDTFRGVFLPFNSNDDILLPFIQSYVQIKKK